MAEFAAVVGLTASIIQLISTGKKVADRIREFQNNIAFAHLNTKLAVLSLTLNRITEAQEQQPLDTKTQEALLDAVSECQRLLTQLDALIARMSPAEKDSKLRRAFKGLRSFGKDRRLVEIQVLLDTAVDQLANYLAVDASLNSRTNALRLGEGGTSKSTPTVKAEKAIFDVPAQHVSVFVGRKGLMDKVDAGFTRSDPDSAGPKLVILVGMGGQGKTQLALNYCRKHRSAYKAVFWVDASSAQTAANTFDKITAILETRGFVNSGSSKKDFVKDYLDGMDNPWMLVFDNYDSPGVFGDIKSYFPSGNGSIIITSRHAESKRLGCPISVDSLSEDEAMQLLLQKSETEDTEANRSEAVKIVKTLACLALAVDQAAAYISLRHLPISQFIQRYDQSKEGLMRFVPNSPLWEYRRCLDDAEKETSLSVFTTWEMSFRQIAELDKEQDAIGHFLTLSSFFNPAKISESIFAECSADRFLSGSIPDWLKIFYQEEVWDGDSFQEVVSGLANLSLIQRYEIETRQHYQASWFTLHPLVRDWLQLRLSTEEQQKYSWQALEVLRATEATRLEGLRHYFIIDELLLHLQSLLKYSEEDGLPDSGIVETRLPLLEDLAWLASQPDGSFTFAEALWLKIIFTSAQCFGQHSATTSANKINLAILYRNFNLYDHAIKTMQDVLPFIETSSPDKDLIDLALCVLAKCYEGRGDFSQAKGLYLHALAIAPRFRTALMQYKLSNLYKDLGNYMKAETFIEQSLQCQKTPEVMMGLVKMYHRLGKIEEAEAMYLRALDTYPNASEPSQRRYGQLCSELGDIYADIGCSTKAEKCRMEALRVAKKWCNPAKSEQAFFIYARTAKVGMACYKAGHLLEAKAYCLEAKPGFEELEYPSYKELVHGMMGYLATINEKLCLSNEPTSSSKEA